MLRTVLALLPDASMNARPSSRVHGKSLQCKFCSHLPTTICNTHKTNTHTLKITIICKKYLFDIQLKFAFITISPLWDWVKMGYFGNSESNILSLYSPVTIEKR